MLIRTLLLLSCFSAAPLMAFDWEASLDAVGGYRYDTLSTEIYVDLPEGTRFGTDNLRGRNLSVFEVGFKGEVLLGQNWFVRFDGETGYFDHGRYYDQQVFAGVRSESKALIKDGNTLDGTIAGGYVFCFHPNFLIGPVVGWSYDSQRINMSHATSDGIADTTLDGLNYKMWWQGPFLGLETHFYFIGLAITAAYEFHFSDWHAKWTLAGPDVFGGSFSDVRHASNSYGSVVFVDATYRMCGWLDLGMGMKYQNYWAWKGRVTPQAGSFAAIGDPAESARIHNATWRSIEFTLRAGVHF